MMNIKDLHKAMLWVYSSRRKKSENILEKEDVRKRKDGSAITNCPSNNICWGQAVHLQSIYKYIFTRYVNKDIYKVYKWRQYVVFNL